MKNSNAAILYSAFAVTILAIGLIVVSILFLDDAVGLIEEYENVTGIWKNNRIQYCSTCSNDSSIYWYNRQPYCQNGRDGCYRDRAEGEASLLDYNELLRKSSDYFQKYIDDYKFTTYGSGETVIKEKVAQLMSYPQSWITINALGISFGAFQLILIILLGISTISFRKKFENTIEKCWMGVFGIWFLLSLTLFIGALVWKIDYLCPGLQYESKYGGSSGCTGARTYGRTVAGFLGTDLVICSIVTCYLFRGYFRSRTDK